MFGKVGKVGIIIGWVEITGAGIGLMFDHFWVGLLVIVVGLGIEYVVFRVFRGPNIRQRRLLANGEEATATIREIVDTGVTVNMNPMVRLTLEVKPKSGKLPRAQAKTIISRLDVPSFQPDATVPVVNNPANPHEAAVGTKPGSEGAAGQLDPAEQKELEAALRAIEETSEEIIAREGARQGGPVQLDGRERERRQPSDPLHARGDAARQGTLPGRGDGRGARGLGAAIRGRPDHHREIRPGRLLVGRRPPILTFPDSAT